MRERWRGIRGAFFSPQLYRTCVVVSLVSQRDFVDGVKCSI